MSGSRRKSSSSRPKDILLNSLNNLSIREDSGPHQFRHLVAKLYLDRHPDAFETVQRLLGHKSRETTMRFYRELDAILAGSAHPASTTRQPAFPALRTHRSTKTTPSLLSELLQVARSVVQRLSKSRSLPLPVRFGVSGLPVPGDGQSAS